MEPVVFSALRKVSYKFFGLRVTGGRYFGQLNGNTPHGEGILRYSNGSAYKGQFQNGLKNGFGKITHKSGFSYSGPWRKGRTFGNGQLKYKNGDFYNGGTNSLLRDGHGSLHIKHLSIQIKSEWKNDGAVGKIEVMHRDFSFCGTIKSPTKFEVPSSAEQFLNFLKINTHGTVRFPDGTAIEGIWIDHANADSVKLTDSSGIVWMGNIRNGKIDGLAQATLPNGEVYDCFWRDGVQVRAIGGKLNGDRPRYLLN
jgi:hypothetical protein